MLVHFYPQVYRRSVNSKAVAGAAAGRWRVMARLILIVAIVFALLMVARMVRGVPPRG
jgi:hypothetical protein